MVEAQEVGPAHRRAAAGPVREPEAGQEGQAGGEGLRGGVRARLQRQLPQRPPAAALQPPQGGVPLAPGHQPGRAVRRAQPRRRPPVPGDPAAGDAGAAGECRRAAAVLQPGGRRPVDGGPPGVHPEGLRHHRGPLQPADGGHQLPARARQHQEAVEGLAHHADGAPRPDRAGRHGPRRRRPARGVPAAGRRAARAGVHQRQAEADQAVQGAAGADADGLRRAALPEPGGPPAGQGVLDLRAVRRHPVRGGQGPGPELHGPHAARHAAPAGPGAAGQGGRRRGPAGLRRVRRGPRPPAAHPPRAARRVLQAHERGRQRGPGDDPGDARGEVRGRDLAVRRRDLQEPRGGVLEADADGRGGRRGRGRHGGAGGGGVPARRRHHPREHQQRPGPLRRAGAHPVPDPGQDVDDRGPGRLRGDPGDPRLLHLRHPADLPAAVEHLAQPD